MLVVAEEFRTKLDQSVLELSFVSRFAADLSVRARGFKAMVGADVEVVKAVS